MSETAKQPTAAEALVWKANDKHEIDRLRLLLQKACRDRKAFSIEIEPSAKGFAIIVTGVKEDDELRMALLVAEHLQVLFQGAVRFTAAISELYKLQEDAVEPPK